jgi:hypothetical protein
MSIFHTLATVAFHNHLYIMPIIFTLATDQSRDVSDASDSLLFIRGLNSDLELIENLASLHTAASGSA